MPEELRVAFHRDLQLIEDRVLRLFALVAEGLAAATDALLSDDREAAHRLAAKDADIDELYREIESLVKREFALQTPMARDLRFMLTILRIVPELERSHDLAEHIATCATRGVTSSLTPRIRGLLEQMGRTGVELWHRSAAAFQNRDIDAADRLDELDDDLDELHVSLTAELVSGAVSMPIAIELTLVARYYERLGDHAVNIAKRVRYLAGGEV